MSRNVAILLGFLTVQNITAKLLQELVNTGDRQADNVGVRPVDSFDKAGCEPLHGVPARFVEWFLGPDVPRDFRLSQLRHADACGLDVDEPPPFMADAYA